MSGQLLIGMYIGGLLSSVALHWLYQRSAAKDEKRWRAEMKRCRDEIARLRLTDAEQKALERQASWLASDESFACDMMRKDAATLRGLLARSEDER